MIYAYVFKFKTGEVLNIKTEIDVDLHNLGGGYLAFDDILIDLSEVLYLRKFVYNTDKGGLTYGLR